VTESAAPPVHGATLHSLTAMAGVDMWKSLLVVPVALPRQMAWHIVSSLLVSAALAVVGRGSLTTCAPGLHSPCKLESS
jgi:hypothetical protein